MLDGWIKPISDEEDCEEYSHPRRPRSQYGYEPDAEQRAFSLTGEFGVLRAVELAIKFKKLQQALKHKQAQQKYTKKKRDQSN